MPAHAAPGRPDVTMADRYGDRPVGLGRNRTNFGVDEGSVLSAGVDRLR
jgi:hypothetical protein